MFNSPVHSGNTCYPDYPPDSRPISHPRIAKWPRFPNSRYWLDKVTWWVAPQQRNHLDLCHSQPTSPHRHSNSQLSQDFLPLSRTQVTDLILNSPLQFQCLWLLLASDVMNGSYASMLLVFCLSCWQYINVLSSARDSRKDGSLQCLPSWNTADYSPNIRTQNDTSTS